MSSKSHIIPGYNGIMDLDLQNIDINHRKQAIDQHYNDIKKYIKDQSEISPRLRYENTIMRIHKIHKRDIDALEKHALDAKQSQMKLDAIYAKHAIQYQIKLNALQVK